MTKAILMLSVTAIVSACVATGKNGNGGQVDQNGSQSRSLIDGDTPAIPKAGLTPRQRFLRAVQQLEIGNAKVAKVELDEYLISTPDSSRAKYLLKQITTPAKEFYPATFFTVELAFGQSISTLAQHYLGGALEFYALAKYNGIENPSRINTGSKIKIPLTAHAISVRESDAQLALKKKQQDKSPQDDTVQPEPVVKSTENQTIDVEGEAEEVLVEDEAESAETLKVKLEDANHLGDFKLSLEHLEALESLGIELDGDARMLASEALVGRANQIKVKQTTIASQMYARAAGLMQQNGDEISAFDYFKLAYDTDNTNAIAEQNMTQLRQQIVDKFHREASIAFRQQRIDEAIEKWDVVLHVDPSNTNVSAYRTQAVELQQRLKALHQ